MDSRHHSLHPWAQVIFKEVSLDVNRKRHLFTVKNNATLHHHKAHGDKLCHQQTCVRVQVQNTKDLREGRVTSKPDLSLPVSV